MTGHLIDVLVPYHNPLYHETVKAELHEGGWLAGEPAIWELREHAGFVPLAPGDKVRINSANAIIELVSLEPQFVFSVFCRLPAGVTFGMAPDPDHPGKVAVAKFEEELRRDAVVTAHTPFTFLISAPDEKWFDDKVRDHPYVEFSDTLRTPETELDLDTLLANPAFHGDVGPL